MNTQSHLVLFLAEKKLTAWQFSAHTPARSLRVRGEEQLNIRHAEDLSEAWNDTYERLQGDGLTPHSVHWVLDNAGLAQWAQMPPHASTTSHTHHRINVWQVLAWEWVLARFRQAPTAQMSGDWIQTTLIPWLLNTNSETEQQHLRDALHREHQSESARLEDERRRLQEENRQLRLQNAAIQKVDSEQLVRFLPALFPRVFTLIGAIDLAALCGQITPFNLPNPYPEPSDETLRTLQQQFRSLPIDRQKQIVRFVRDLPQRQKLTARPEMRALITQLEEF